MKIDSIAALEQIVASKGQRKILALAVAQDAHALDAVARAVSSGYIDAILVGNRPQIEEIASAHSINITGLSIWHEPDNTQAVAKAVSLIRNGEAQILMKGNVATGTLLKGVLNKENGLQSGGLLSHIAFFELKGYHKLLALTDVAMNIAPTLDEKVQIIRNAVQFMHKLGMEQPKVAALTAVELVNTKMPATLDAAILTQMNRRGQIPGCTLDGPLALDNAISRESAEHKGIKSEVAGDADLLLFPTIEAGNAVYKSLAAFGTGQLAAVILGATAPIVLTSRSDSEQSKLNSILLAAAAS